MTNASVLTPLQVAIAAEVLAAEPFMTPEYDIARNLLATVDYYRRIADVWQAAANEFRSEQMLEAA